MQQELERIQDAYSRMNSYYKIIQDYRLEYPDEDRAQLLAIHPWYNMMLSAVAEAELKKESTIKLFSDLISTSLNETCREKEQLKLSVSSRRFLEESSGYEPVYLDLSRHKREVDHLLTQTAELQRYGHQLLYQKGILHKNKNKKDPRKIPSTNIPHIHIHTTFYILHTTHYILHTTYTFYILHTTYYIYILHTTYYILHSTYYILHSTFYILHSTFYILHTTYYILHTTFYILHSTFYILHTTYYILHTTYYILHSTYYILHST